MVSALVNTSDHEKDEGFSDIHPSQGPQPITLQPRSLRAPVQQMYVRVCTLPRGYTQHGQDVFPEARMDPVALQCVVLLLGWVQLPSHCSTPAHTYTYGEGNNYFLPKRFQISLAPVLKRDKVLSTRQKQRSRDRPLPDTQPGPPPEVQSDTEQRLCPQQETEPQRKSLHPGWRDCVGHKPDKQVGQPDNQPETWPENSQHTIKDPPETPYQTQPDAGRHIREAISDADPGQCQKLCQRNCLTHRQRNTRETDRRKQAYTQKNSRSEGQRRGQMLSQEVSTALRTLPGTLRHTVGHTARDTVRNAARKTARDTAERARAGETSVGVSLEPSGVGEWGEPDFWGLLRGKGSCLPTAALAPPQASLALCTSSSCGCWGPGCPSRAPLASLGPDWPQQPLPHLRLLRPLLPLGLAPDPQPRPPLQLLLRLRR